jgi:hypothetical protein
MSQFEAFWERVLASAEPEAIELAERTLAAVQGFDVELELSVFTDEDAPWLPSVWVTPMGRQHWEAARASDASRQLLNVSFGEDGEAHLNAEEAPLGGIFEPMTKPEDPRAALGALIAAWIGRIWDERFADRAEAVVRQADGC